LGLSLQTFNLPLVHKELADPVWLVVVIIGMGVRADVGLHEKELTILYPSVAILEIGTSLPQRFDLCAK
jgi:hypothetical protein